MTNLSEFLGNTDLDLENADPQTIAITLTEECVRFISKLSALADVPKEQVILVLLALRVLGAHKEATYE